MWKIVFPHKKFGSFWSTKEPKNQPNKQKTNKLKPGVDKIIEIWLLNQKLRNSYGCSGAVILVRNELGYSVSSCEMHLADSSLHMSYYWK